MNSVQVWWLNLVFISEVANHPLWRSFVCRVIAINASNDEIQVRIMRTTLVTSGQSTKVAKIHKLYSKTSATTEAD